MLGWKGGGAFSEMGRGKFSSDKVLGLEFRPEGRKETGGGMRGVFLKYQESSKSHLSG